MAPDEVKRRPPPQKLQHGREAVPGDIVDDEVDAVGPKRLDGITVMGYHAIRTQRFQRLGFGRRGQCRDMRTAPPGKLYRRRPDAARGAGHQHLVAGMAVRPMKHCLGSGVGTGYGCEFRIAPVAVDCKYLGCRHLHILGEGTVKI